MNGVLAGSVASSSKLQASEALEAAHAKIVQMLPEGMIQISGGSGGQFIKRLGFNVGWSQERTIWQQWLDPELPPLLAPIPGLCRLIAISIIAPIIFVCLTDFAGYAIFRTLGFRRRRVRVKESQQQQQQQQQSQQNADPTALTAFNLAAATTSSSSSSPRQRGSESPTMIKAPLLSPGAYDADALLRHRARSISGESAEAEEEWNRTGGSFARVSTVRASQEAAAAKSKGEKQTLSSLKHMFARAQHVGVEGALGYSDTDADDSGGESGRSSPEMGKSPPWRRRGLSSGLGFTPVSPKDSMENEQDFFGKSAINKSMYYDDSPPLHSPILPSSQDNTHVAASRAADLEPAEPIVAATTTTLSGQAVETR